jgi:integrase
MKLDMSNALRPSELFPLRWRCFLEETGILDIQETVYKGKVRSFGKTKGSLTKVPIAEVLAIEIMDYREECRKKGKDTWRQRMDATSMLSLRHSSSKPSSGFSTEDLAAATRLRRARRSIRQTSSRPSSRKI